MKYAKKFIALLLLATILLEEGLWQGSLESDATIISKEIEWNIQCLNAEMSYEDSKNLSRVKVAVLDSGLDTDKDIPYAERKDFLGDSELNMMYQDLTGHGTAVAGLICASENDDRITGIAANVDLYVGRILDENNQATVDRAIEGIEWAISEDVDIIHISFGTKTESEELEEAIKKAYDRGILIIAAAGNDGHAEEDESTIEYPAAYDEVIAVGGTGTDNEVLDTSSTGEEMDVVAPGTQILSTGAFGGVTVGEGTSLSATQVTGIAATLWGRYPGKSNEFIRSLMVGSANAEAVSGDCGEGMVDYEQSVENYTTMNKTYQLCKAKGFSETESVELAKDSLPQNKEDIVSHQGEVNYVNGLWCGTNHEELAEKGGSITGQNLTLVKAGATLPDSLDEMKTLTAHPCFHGGGNYFANVSYLLDYAKQLAKENNDTLPDFKNFFATENDYTDINRIKNKNIEKELNSTKDIFFNTCASKISADSLTTEQKGYAILGLALHTITDTFSHMGYRKNTKKSNVYFKIVHNWDGDPSEAEHANHISLLWKDIVNSSETTASDKEYYNYMINKFAIADEADELEIRYLLAGDVAERLIVAFRGSTNFLDQMAEVLENYTDDTNIMDTSSDSENIPVNFALANANDNWAAAVTSTSKNFAINIDTNFTVEKVKKSKINVKVKDKKVIVTFPHKKDYTYQVYYKKGNTKTFFKHKVKSGNNRYISPTKGMQGNTIYIVSFYRGDKSTRKYPITYKIIYRYKKKKKTQTVKFNPKKLSYKLYGNVFNLKKKNFKGWSKKKNAKKASYASKKKMSFTANGKLKLYCVCKQ